MLMNWSKNKTVIIALLGVLLQIFSRFTVNIGICESYASKCHDLSYLLLIYTLSFIPFFIYSLITYKLKESTFDFWKKFSILWIALSLLVITFLPTSTHGMDYFPIVKGTVILFLTIVYSITSLLLIIYKSFKKD